MSILKPLKCSYIGGMLRLIRLKTAPFYHSDSSDTGAIYSRDAFFSTTLENLKGYLPKWNTNF